jgi:hypothetical protein
MGGDKPVRRMTLRQLLSHSEKCSRDLIELVRTGLLSQICDFRELCRPVRRRSHYPSMVAVQNSLRKLQDAAKHTQEMAAMLKEHLETVNEHAHKEQTTRR